MINFEKLINLKQIYLKSIVDYHLLIFPDGLISSLGSNFVEAYYKDLFTLPSYSLYLATDEKRMLGFIGYIQNQNDLDHLPVLKSVKILAIKKILSFQLNPVILIRALIKKWLGRKVNHLPELMMIAVDPEARRLGIGSKLVKKMEEDLISNNLMSYCVYTDNPEGLQFYKKLGLETIFSFKLFSKTSACFVKHLKIDNECN